MSTQSPSQSLQLHFAKQSLQNLCPNSTSASAWFDTCYLAVKSSQTNFHSYNYSCSNQITKAQDRAYFEPDIEQLLLLSLRADIYHRLSTGFIQHKTGARIYGIIKCGKSLSDKECQVCASKSIDKLYEKCGGKEGGTVATEHCVVRYEPYQFCTKFNSSRSIDGGNVLFYNKEAVNGESSWKLKAELIWGLCCMLLIVLCAFVLKTFVILNTDSKVRDEFI